MLFLQKENSIELEMKKCRLQNRIYMQFCVNFLYFILFNEYILLFLHRVSLRHGNMPIENTHKQIVELIKI